MFFSNIKNKLDKAFEKVPDSIPYIYKMKLQKINKIDLSNYNDEELKNRAITLAEKVREGLNIDDVLIEAYSLVKEAFIRVMKINPFDTQILASIALHEGKLVEMQTGEGKTIAAVFPAFLNALSKKGVHVLTFNDYLAKRDAKWMEPVYNYLGISVGYIIEGLTNEEKKEAYSKDITYITATEAGLDYLRDCLAYNKEELIQRPFNYALVDEADSILIDEARVPLVIAGERDYDKANLTNIATLVKELKPYVHYEFDEYKRNIYMTDDGLNEVEKRLGVGNLYAEENIEILTEINSAIHAENLLTRDVHYIVKDGIIKLIDEHTGRIADKRNLPDGLQAALEAKEGLELRAGGRILGTLTLQNYLSLYPKICGMTATAFASAEEFRKTYSLEVVVIPTYRPCIRIDYPDVVFTHKEAKYRALAEEIQKVHAEGRPILLGTASVEESELIAGMLKDMGLLCKVLNAKNNEAEAEIIKKAGKLHAITVSTNMAGRGVDIQLGGGEEEEGRKVAKLGGLYVIGTNRHESVRVDNQLRGRAGRQGDPGSTKFFISLEDDLIKKFRINDVIQKRYLELKSDNPIQDRDINKSIIHIQKVVDGQNYDIRKNLNKYFYIIEHQRRIISKLRFEILTDIKKPECLGELGNDEISKDLYSKVEYGDIKKYIVLATIDKYWAEYLDYVEYIREGIHLVSISKKDPLDEFHKCVIQEFDLLKIKIYDNFIKTLKSIDLSKPYIEIQNTLKRPSATWTYVITDNYYLNKKYNRSKLN